MKSISLKLDDLIFQETEEILLTNKKPRNRYINDALSYYNQIQRRFQLEKVLLEESNAVYVSSVEVMKEFESIDDEL
jgi:hypothetical protein